MAENEKQIQVHFPEEHIEKAKAVAEVVSERMAEAIQSIPDEILAMSMDDLQAQWKVSAKDEMLRRAFWEEYDRCLKEKNDALVPVRIYGQICSRQYFYDYVLKNPYRVAYMLHETERIEPKFKRLIHAGYEKLEKAILTAKYQYDNGHMDARAVKTAHEILEFMYTRVYGAAVQKHEIKALNVNVDKSNSGPTLENKLEDIREKLHSVETAKIVSGTSRPTED